MAKKNVSLEEFNKFVEKTEAKMDTILDILDILERMK